MRVPCYYDEPYTWQVATDPEYADWHAEIPSEVLDRYLKAKKAYDEARAEMGAYVFTHAKEE